MQGLDQQEERGGQKRSRRRSQDGLLSKALAALARMLEAERPDLVSVCLPNEAHFETTMAIIEAGVPLFVEKPLVFELEQADALLAAADAARRAADLLAPAQAIADTAELAAVELRVALAELGQISGQIVADDILGRIFARFCVGK